MEFISYEEALKIIGENTFDSESEIVALEESNNRILDEDLKADRDFPPFDRVTMDGIAISFQNFESGTRRFKIEKIAAAGSPQTTLENDGYCIEVMTGAMLPMKTDTVIRYEDLNITEGVAQVVIEEIKNQQNVHFQSIDRKIGDIIVKKGGRIASPEINVAASIGKSSLKVRRQPKAVIISTGDELVKVSEIPKPFQIRRSNSHGIASTLEKWGIESELLHLSDNEDEIERVLKKVLQEYKMVILTGGVSKGKFDYLPKIFDRLGVKKLFHKIRQRPGKPFWFGKSPEGSVVFALPGNPVSSFMCTQIYIRYWLVKSLQLEESPIYARLTGDVTFNKELTLFVECNSHINADGILEAQPVFGNGSGDFANLVDGDGFLKLPADRNEFAKGEVFPFFPYRHQM